MREEFVYLDNAATSWPKPGAVYAAINACMQHAGANPGRSSHRMSVRAERVMDETRLLAARLFNAPGPSHVVFTLNCTDSLNIALKGLVREGSRVVTGPYEHNSVVRPLRSLEREGAVVRVARAAPGSGVDMDDFEDLCREGVDVAVISHASNVTGRVEPVAELAGIVHRNGGLLVVDAAQTAGTLEIDLVSSGIDVLAAPGHKGLMGPMGVGLLVFGRDLDLRPWREGGTGFRSEDEEQPGSLPWRLEAGTPNLPGIAGLGAGIRFVESEGIRSIAEKESSLARELTRGLAEIPGVRLYSDPEFTQSGIVSFTIDSLDVSMAGVMLDEASGIGVRAGLHCAPAAHRSLGTFPGGTLRASFGYFNNNDHVERLLAAVRQLAVHEIR
ncbi:MAG: aminotransferase class V-fold PLP-dependent enzyme [Firmicutes bacterium]|nr:aminotransferase class V-fold PLP-dependent enzyme [Bacillota bacterium]